MIADIVVWIGEHAAAVFSVGVGAIAIGLAIYLARDMPIGPEVDEHAHERFI